MKALSLTPPWPGAILHLGKRIENRLKWQHGCRFRGPILLHAAKGIGTRADFDETVESILQIVNGDTAAVSQRLKVERSHGRWVPGDKMLRAGFVGRASIVATIQSEADFELYAGGDPERADQRRWWFGGFALVLADVEPLPFRPYPGSLGLFEVPDRSAAE
jgi:hypothetical protein